MCGICGFTNPWESGADEPVLKAMCDAIAHRGPDGEGQYFDGGIALGHRRLSLIDLEGGNQPMVRATGEHEARVTSPAKNPDGTLREDEESAMQRGQWAIVFNGEIYNYRELRAELEADGWSFETNSDTEVLLVGYIAWAEKVLERLRGMFAFAIWNAETRELFCARDFFGIKPFYYALCERAAAQPATDEPAADEPAADAPASGEPAADEPTSDEPAPDDSATPKPPVAQPATDEPQPDPVPQFIFASEIKAILEHPSYHRELNEDALATYLCFQFSALQETFFKGIFKLPQGHCLRVRADGTVEVARYWRPRYEPNTARPLAETVEQIDQAMHESVRFHNVADVEVGSFLSSGVDSSYLAACLAQENPDIKTFTVGFSEYVDERDEVSWAHELAEKLEVENDSKLITEEEYWEVLPKVQWHMDEPSADPSAVALYFVDQLAAQRVKAVLSGEGADEFFGGYRIYQVPSSSAKVAWAPRGALHAGSLALRKLGLRGANYLERASEAVEEWYYTNANDVAFSPDEREKILNYELLDRLEMSAHLGGARVAIGIGSQTSDTTFKATGSESERAAIAGAGGMFSPQELTAPVYEEAEGLDEPTRMQYVDLWFWLVGDILLKTDKMSMAHSLESRVPFLDREIFQLAATIPTSQKVTHDQTKVALREAAERSIPHGWAQKEKLGFPVPVASWLREDRYYEKVRAEFTSERAARFFNTDELVKLLDAHRASEHDNTRRIWIIYSFLIWHAAYFD